MSITALQGSNAQAVGYNQPAIYIIELYFFNKWSSNFKIIKIQAVVIGNVDAKADAKKTIDNSENEKQMQTCWRTTFKQFGFSFQKNVAPQHLIPICFAYKTWILVK